MYLVYTPLEKLSTQDQVALASDLGIAALVSKDIYNFGELVNTKKKKKLLVLFSLNIIFSFTNSWDIQSFQL
jgi:hypothetical protein